jgi:hypothetical protein
VKPSFHTPLDLEVADDGRQYRLLTAFQYDSSLTTITVPAGFVTDFASVPKLFWNLLPPTGRYGKAAVVHDVLQQDRLHRQRRPVPLPGMRAASSTALREAPRVYRRFGLFAGRRGGKSVVGAHGAREECWSPTALGWICGPT